MNYNVVNDPDTIEKTDTESNRSEPGFVKETEGWSRVEHPRRELLDHPGVEYPPHLSPPVKHAPKPKALPPAFTDTQVMHIDSARDRDILSPDVAQRANSVELDDVSPVVGSSRKKGGEVTLRPPTPPSQNQILDWDDIAAETSEKLYSKAEPVSFVPPPAPAPPAPAPPVIPPIAIAEPQPPTKVDPTPPSSNDYRFFDQQRITPAAPFVSESYDPPKDVPAAPQDIVRALPPEDDGFYVIQPTNPTTPVPIAPAPLISTTPAEVTEITEEEGIVEIDPEEDDDSIMSFQDAPESEQAGPVFRVVNPTS
jgi:hypothetical protein